MPVVRSDFRGCRKRDFCFFKFAERNKKQSADAPQQVNCVSAGENIEEAAGLVAGDVYTLRNKLAPRNKLPSYEKKTKHRGR